MKKLPKLLICSLLSLVILTIFPLQHVSAADISSIGIATYLPVNGKIEDGDIISSTAKGYFVSQRAYDPQIVGVVTSKPAIALKTNSQQKGVPVVNVGTVFVKVNNINGSIKKGDFVAASEQSGVGMKATKSGYIIGEALQDATFSGPKDIKKIAVTLNLHFLQLGSPVNSSLLQIFALSQLATYEEPLNVFKYVISALILIASFGFGFIIFSRTITTGLEALGRNPDRKRVVW